MQTSVLKLEKSGENLYIVIWKYGVAIPKVREKLPFSRTISCRKSCI